jgi:hypothetical protein
MKSLKLSLVAFVLGGCIAITQSSFRPALTDIHWGYNQSTGTFVNLTGKVEDNSANPAPGTYSCLASANICSGFKATQPTAPSQMTSREPGDFVLNP